MQARNKQTSRERQIVITARKGGKSPGKAAAKKCIVKFCVKDPKTGTETCNEVEVKCDPKLPFPKLRG
jgi:hypothetical protein